MINLTIHARNGHLYELTSRYNQPQSSAAQRYTNTSYLTERTIAYLSLEPETWLQILARINCRPASLYSYHEAGVHKEVANAIMRGDLILYKLPLLNANNSLRGSKDIGLCIIKGPKLHCATNLSPVPIASKQTAQMLLADLGIGTHALLSYLNSHNLYNSYNQSNPLDEVFNRLANKELLAYQIQLPPMSVPEKKFELVAATGPGYDPVSLGPERSSKTTDSNKPTTQEIQLAKSEGSTPAHIAAREKVARIYLKENEFSETQIADALGSADGSRSGGVDLTKPLSVISFPPPEKMTQYVMPHAFPGNWFDPKGNQTPDALGISAKGRTKADFLMPKGTGLSSHSKPIIDTWTTPGNSVSTNGGGIQLFINDRLRKDIITLNKIGS